MFASTLSKAYNQTKSFKYTEKSYILRNSQFKGE